MIGPGRRQHNTALFPACRLLLDLRAISTIRFPANVGSALHGGFGAALKSLVCVVKDTPCAQCRLYRSCAYPYLFETPPPLTTARMPKAQMIPRPYVLEPPQAEKSVYPAGETLQVGLVLIGKAISYLPFFLEAFALMGRRGISQGTNRFSLERWRLYDAPGGPASVRLAGEEFAKATGGPASAPLTGEAFAREHDSASCPVPLHRLKVQLLTPTRIEHAGQPVRRLDFPTFFSSLLRRLRNLQFFHYGLSDEEDDRRLRDLSQTITVATDRLIWLDQRRLSHGRWTPQGGLMGELSFQGDLTAYLQFLRLGELVHVGKGTTFGMGRYELVTEVKDSI
ncbi:MAG: CRISPR system precrRNA processing endoribonuclease RAMP protein Cas6 [Acidobacteria bacterium]|nr:CRISPR system precrRNA processing endoribonuclease RAMP protein Cas6 [Acidobacteriota bacterium]MBI3657019.1 CRISPR system precrRNA processing endoribonuclease RAMP protein Cas6 [Acidobacteriota bacterium]